MRYNCIYVPLVTPYKSGPLSRYVRASAMACLYCAAQSMGLSTTQYSVMVCLHHGHFEMGNKQDMKTFKQVLDARIYKIRATLSAKAGEYASTQNRYHNFDIASRIANVTPEQALYGMMLKHEVSVLDLVAWTRDAEDKITKEMVDEKVGDYINYLILLEGLLLRRIEAREEGEKKDT